MRGAGAGADEMYSEGHLRLQNVCIAMSSGERRGKRERERARQRERGRTCLPECGDTA